MLTRKARTWLVAGMATLVAGALAVPAIAQDDDRPAPQGFHETMLSELEVVVGEDAAEDVADVLADLAAERRAERSAAPRGPDAQRPDPEARHQEMMEALTSELDSEQLAQVEEALDTLHEARFEERAEWRAEREGMRGEGSGPRAGNGMGRGPGPHGEDGDCPRTDTGS